MFGWQKIETSIGEVGSAYCFECRRDARWMVWNESEWVTFSALKVLRFVDRHHLECMGCFSPLALCATELEQIGRHMRARGTIEGTPVHASLVRRIERAQLAHKTPFQLRFIKESMKAREECRARISARERT